jgi:FAD/FMN-containing dehydrogenase
VIVDGGATMGTMLDALAPTGRVVPVGIIGHAGFGLATRGGVGYLTRSLGLTLDHLVEVELVLPSGDVVRLSDASSGDEADLWWAVRGCAPPFGVVSSAVFRSHEVGPVWIDRMVVGLDSLATYFQVAPELPRSGAGPRSGTSR